MKHQDKLAHFLAGAAIAAAVLPFNAGAAIFAVTAAAAGKEILDAHRGAYADPLDLIITVTGGLSMIAWLTFIG